MKFWIGAEIDKTAYDAFRLARNEVEQTLNARLASKNYALVLDKFPCISVMRGDNVFGERVLYSAKKRRMDFRLLMDLDKFVCSDEASQRAQIFAMLMRAADILESKKDITASGMHELQSDMLRVGHEMMWI